MLNVGLTGGIGSGKSAASAALADRGAVIVDADKIAREVVEPGTEGLELIEREFGGSVIGPDGSLDRPALAQIVFADERARAVLNGIVHPRVRSRSRELIEAAGPDAIVVNDIPLLAEGTMAPSFHLVVVVLTPEEVRLERLTTSRGMSRDDAVARIRAQASDQQRLAIADEVLDNSETIEHLREQIRVLWDVRLAPYAAALADRRPAGERVKPREGAREREHARLRWVLDPLGSGLYVSGELAEVEGGADARAALHDAGWFGQERLRSADPAGLLEVALPGGH